jgi:hypothetical protein
MLDSKPYFHCHVNFVYSQAVKTLGLTSYITYNLSYLRSLLVLYNALIRPNIEYASVVRNNLTLKD